MRKNEKLLYIVQQLQNHLRFGFQKFQLEAGNNPIHQTSQKSALQPELFSSKTGTPPVIKEAGEQSPTETISTSLKDTPHVSRVSQPIPFEDLEKILAEERVKVTQCIRCRLHRGRRRAVFGEGNIHSPLMLIGEAPGADEDKEGKPFVGAAGQLLTKMLEAIDIRRQDVFITNILKCRPPDNRDPLQDEIEACSLYLKKQIAQINPKIIVTLGKFATSFLLEQKIGIMKLRGQLFEKEGRLIYPLLHPSALLHNSQWKRPTWEDLKNLKKILEKMNFYANPQESL